MRTVVVQKVGETSVAVKIRYYRRVVHVHLPSDQPIARWGGWTAFGLDGRLSIAVTGEAAQRLRIYGGYPRAIPEERWEELLDRVSACRDFLSPIPHVKIGSAILLYSDSSLVALDEPLAHLAEFLAPTSQWLAPSTPGILKVPIRRGREVIVMPMTLEGFDRDLALALWACAKGDFAPREVLDEVSANG